MSGRRAWYLVYTKARQEQLAEENLLRQGYDTYLPRIRQRRRRAGRAATVVEPMFPRYLFIRLGMGVDDWGPIRSTIGVANMVRFGDRTARLDDALVDLLRSREDADGVHIVVPREFRRGETIRIAEGVLSGLEAIYHARTSAQRVIVLLEIAGKTARIRLDADNIEPI